MKPTLSTRAITLGYHTKKASEIREQLDRTCDPIKRAVMQSELRGKLCNELTNLEWVTQKENIRRNIVRKKIVTYRGAEHANAKLSLKQVRLIRRVWPNRQHGTVKKLAHRFGVTHNVVLHAGRGDSYQDVEAK